MAADKKIILASRSLARQKMLEEAGLEFDCVPADLDEENMIEEMLQQGTDVKEIAGHLARAKALHIAKSNSDGLVIGADQTLDLGGEMLSKAYSEQDAKDKLKLLRGKTHRLISAACVVCGNKILWEGSDSAALTMKDFDDDELEDYIKVAGEALTRSVGAYEIESEGRELFSNIKGDTHTILGLPLTQLLAYLEGQHD